MPFLSHFVILDLVPELRLKFNKIIFYESFQPKKFVWCWNKVDTLKESIFKNYKQINLTVTTTIWFLSTEWVRTWPSTVLVSKWKNSGGHRLLAWQMLLFRVDGYGIALTKIKAISLLLLALQPDVIHATFLEHSKERNCTQAFQEFEISHQMFFVQTVNGLKLFTEHAKTLHFRCLNGY